MSIEMEVGQTPELVRRLLLNMVDDEYDDEDGPEHLPEFCAAIVKRFRISGPTLAFSMFDFRQSGYSWAWEEADGEWNLKKCSRDGRAYVVATLNSSPHPPVDM